MGEACPQLTRLITQPEIVRIIECPVCQQVPFPPIYMCATGHNICKLCKPKLKECPLCKSRFSDTRNYSVEQIVMASTHKCAYNDDGCQIEGTGELLCDHIKTCQCRSFKCPGDGNKKCFETISIKSPHAREHFTGKHEAEFCTMFLSELNFTRTTGDHSNVKDTAWPPTLIEEYGKDFLCQTYTRSNVFYWTVFCIGTAEEAQKFNVKILLSSGKDQKSLRLQWRIPVQPIIKCEELRDGNEVKGVLIPSCTFNDFKKVAFRDDDILEYTFLTEYKISKLE